MKHARLERYLFGTSFVLAIALPLSDFRGVLWLVIITAFPVLILVALFLVAGFAVALVRLISMLLKREPRRALPYVAILLLLPTELYVGSWLNEYATTLVCAGGLRSAINQVKAGKKLPVLSQAFPIQVFQTDPEVASYAQMSPLFLAEYVVYDAADRRTSDVAARLRADLDRNSCEVGADRVVGNYYWVSEAC